MTSTVEEARGDEPMINLRIEIECWHLTHGGRSSEVIWRGVWAIHDLLIVALIKAWWRSRKARNGAKAMT